MVRRVLSERFALAALLVGLTAGAAPAQLHDHLHCYKVKDPASFSATVDLRPADDATFQVDTGCVVKVRSRQLCFPTEKDLVSADGPHLDVHGEELANAFLCYKAKCRRGDPPDSLEMSDQFGTRTLSRLRTSMVCAPAILGAPPVTTTTTSTLPDLPPRDCTDAAPPNCDGTCSNYNLACREEMGACVCAYVDVYAPCPTLAGVPECWGSCSGSLSCIEVSGACQCGLAF